MEASVWGRSPGDGQNQQRGGQRTWIAGHCRRIVGPSVPLRPCLRLRPSHAADTIRDQNLFELASQIVDRVYVRHWPDIHWLIEQQRKRRCRAERCSEQTGATHRSHLAGAEVDYRLLEVFLTQPGRVKASAKIH